MRDSKPGHVRLEVVGAYAQDESPYGVRDMAGGVRQWLSSTRLDDPLLRVVRGGGAGASPLTCRIGYRSWHQSTDVTSYFGFRIARSL
jgi:formylglycine-generating enzyme required for sulfatase activity